MLISKPRRLADNYGPLFFGLFLLLCSFGAAGQAVYNPSQAPGMFQTLNKPLGMGQANSTDARSLKADSINLLYRLYNGTSEVLTYLNLPKYRYGWFPIFVNIGGSLQSNGTYIGGETQVYFFKNGTADSNLVRWNTDSLNLPGAPFYSVANNLSEGNAGLIKGNLSLDNVDNTSDAQKNAAAVALTNHTIDGNLNTLQNIPNSALTNKTIGLTLNNSGATPQVTTTPASLGNSIVLSIPYANGSDSGFLRGTDWSYFEGKLDSIHISNDSIYNCAAGNCVYETSIDITVHVNNGLYDSTGTVQFGEPVGTSGSPNRFFLDRELNFNGNRLLLRDTVNSSVTDNRITLYDTIFDYQSNLYKVPLCVQLMGLAQPDQEYMYFKPWNYGQSYFTAYKPSNSIKAMGFSWGISPNEDNAGAGAPDNVFGGGYNIKGGTVRQDTGDAALNLAVETNYLNNLGIVQPNFEVHWPRLYTFAGNEWRINSWYIGKIDGYTLWESHVQEHQYKNVFESGQVYYDIANTGEPNFAPVLTFSNHSNNDVNGKLIFLDPSGRQTQLYGRNADVGIMNLNSNFVPFYYSHEGWACMACNLDIGSSVIGESGNNQFLTVGSSNSFSRTSASVLEVASSTRGARPWPEQTQTQINSIALDGISGALNIVAGGTFSTDGTAQNVPLIGGSGTGALVTAVVAGGTVTSVTVTSGGAGYKSSDILYLDSTFMPGGSGSGGGAILSVLRMASEGLAVYNWDTHRLNLWIGSRWLKMIGANTVGAFSSSSQSNGATITADTITFGPADASNPGMVTTGAQTIAGTKTFTSAPVLTTSSTNNAVWQASGTSGAGGWGPIVTSGTWTPAITTGTNISAGSGNSSTYSRVGNIVTFAGSVNVTVTAAITASAFQISIPVSSTFSAVSDASGTLGANQAFGANPLNLTANTSSGNTLNVAFGAGTATGSYVIYFSGQYLIH